MGPRALTARRILAFTDSMAFVVQTMRRISVSSRRNGVNSSHSFSRSRTIAGYFLPPCVDEVREPIERGFLGTGGVDGLEELGDLAPVLSCGIAGLRS